MTYYPLKMAPCYKEYLWGGKRLKTEYSKADAPDVTAESWELASHADGMSRVANGPLAGKTLNELCELDRVGFWGQDCRSTDFPVLVKLIDAEKDLSVQVHPSDSTALSDLGEHGKAEMWYVVDCVPQASIYLGFSRHVSKDELSARAADGSICEVLNSVPVSPGDVFFILPGTIHAIGAGMVIAEIQQNSNTTFRVYDYKRRDSGGKLRALHLERAAEVLSYEPILPEECKANSLASFPGFSVTEMFSCRYFKAYRVDVWDNAVFCCDGSSFQHLLCVEGEGMIVRQNISFPFRQGESFFLPAALGEYEIRGNCRLLLSRV